MLRRDTRYPEARTSVSAGRLGEVPEHLGVGSGVGLARTFNLGKSRVPHRRLLLSSRLTRLVALVPHGSSYCPTIPATSRTIATASEMAARTTHHVLARSLPSFRSAAAASASSKTSSVSVVSAVF